MADIPQHFSEPNPESFEVDVPKLVQQLRRKEGSWVEWGQACQMLQKAGYSPQSIFEETGFEPIQQNQVVVAAQVYASILAAGTSEDVQAHFGRKGSDVLYELRILANADRASVAALALEKNLDLEEAREAARAVKECSRVKTLPSGFTHHPGDAFAYQIWKQARQKSDLQERSRLIAKGLRFAHSEAARKQIEQLLTDFTVVPAQKAPQLPMYRLEEDEMLPRLIPVVGKLPLTKADLQAVPLVEEMNSFGMVHFTGAAAWVGVPGWQVVRLAEDPVALLCASDTLPQAIAVHPEDVLVLVDRSQRDWDINSYFLAEQNEQLTIQWFDQTPDVPLLGRIVLVMRAKKVLDANYTNDPWQMDE